MRRIGAFLLPAAIAAVAATTPAVWAATECRAELDPKEATDQVSDEAITKVFAVEVKTDVDCAKVYVDFVVTERLFDGERITSKHRGWRKVTVDGTLHKVNYRIAKDTTIEDWKFEVVRCVVCGTE